MHVVLERRKSWVQCLYEGRLAAVLIDGLKSTDEKKERSYEMIVNFFLCDIDIKHDIYVIHKLFYIAQRNE